MRRVGTTNTADLEDLPAGYMPMRVASGVQLIMPSALARRREAQIRQQEQREVDAKHADFARAMEEPKDKTRTEGRDRNAGAKQADFSEEPLPGWYRVLPRLQEMLEEDERGDITLKAVDKDVRERHVLLRAKLKEKGPDRRLVAPANWKDTISELETALPHFEGPIRMLRDSLALADVTGRPVRMPPMLLLGPPGVGKTYFSHRVADMMGAAHAAIAFDQPSAHNSLRGSDKHWATTETGLLFNLICLGDCANPVILLDEIDKCSSDSSRGTDMPLAQLLSVLEPETARRTVDISADIEFDASMVTYIATANTLRGLTAPILSRLEVFNIEPPEPSAAVEIARSIVSGVLERLGLAERLVFERRYVYVLAHLSPRLMLRAVEKSVAAAVRAGQWTVGESDLWPVIGLEEGGPRLH